MRTKSSGSSGSKKANQYFNIIRQSNGYEIYDKMNRNIICKMWVADWASDDINTKLRDAVANAYYTYGKDLGFYRQNRPYR